MTSLSPAIMNKYPSLAKAMVANIESHDGREIKLLQHIYEHPNLDELRNSPSKLAEAIDDFAAQHEFLINIGPDKANIMRNLVIREEPAVFVELGGYVGYSAIVVGDAMRKCSPPNGSRLYSLELDPLCASIAMNLVNLAGLGDIVKIVTGAAADTLTRLKADGTLEKIDMLFLDHVEALYVQDFKVCEELELLRSGSLVVADNVVRPGAPEYRSLVRSQARLESWGVPGLIIPGEFEDELEVTRVK